eukprot:COSAG02_NODE_2648_length_8336_cov_3.970378_3_plen_127_part_00
MITSFLSGTTPLRLFGGCRARAVGTDNITCCCHSPLFGDTVPESALAPAAGAALSRPTHGTNRSERQAGSAAELRAMRRQLDGMHDGDIEKPGGENIAFQMGPIVPVITLYTHFSRGLRVMLYYVA